MLSDLVEYHERMLGAVRRAEPLIKSHHPLTLELNDTRTELAQLIASHHVFVHREIFQPVLSDGTDAEVRRARQLKAECVGLTEAFRLYTSGWLFDDVETRWAQYQDSAIPFNSELNTRICYITGLGALLAKADSEQNGGLAKLRCV